MPVFLRAFPLKDDSASVSKLRRPAERLREVRWQEDQTLDRRGPIYPPSRELFFHGGDSATVTD
jgi:hypothetical protein